jgi:hypothetical protein
MERYPEKVAVAVFATATMPAAGKPMTYAFKQVRICSDRKKKSVLPYVNQLQVSSLPCMIVQNC